MKELLLPIVVALLFVLTLGLLAYEYGTPYIKPYFENRITGMVIGDLGIDITVADSPRERERGLSGLPSLPKDSGLLFIFDKADFHGIWMKDMNFAIDVIWIDENFQVIDITHSLEPESFPNVYEPKSKARMALEVNALFAATHDIKVGDTVRIAPEYLPEDLKNR